MADGSASPSPIGGIGSAVEHARAIAGTTAWDTPGVLIKKSRSWHRTSAAVVSRGRGEGYWRGNQPIVCLALSDVQKSSAQLEGGRVQPIAADTPRPLAFRPARVGVRTIFSVPITFAVVSQAPETYRDLASEVSSPANFADFEPLQAFDDVQARLLLQTIVGEINGDKFSHLLVDALNTALAVQIARRFHGLAVRLLPVGRLSRERLKRVVDYVEAHLDNALSLSDLAAVACLSPYHFSRCFKRSMGVAPHRYIMERRIERARTLLLHSDMPLTDIAAVVGFDSQAYFTSCFSREAGVSPGRLRRERA
jgi:AraC family transcriptional regulator